MNAITQQSFGSSFNDYKFLFSVWLKGQVHGVLWTFFNLNVDMVCERLRASSRRESRYYAKASWNGRECAR